MKIRTLTYLFLFFALFTKIYSQDIYFCESYSEDGKPIGPTNKLEIKPYGTAIYILLESKIPLNDPLLYIFVDKRVNDKFIPLDSKTINIKTNDKWAVTSYEFKEAGEYEIYFLNSSQRRLASGKLTTFLADEFKNKIIIPNAQFSGDCELTFCELVINGKPVNRFNTLSLAQSEGEAFIYIKNHTPLGIEKFILQVWRKSELNSSNEELVDSKKFRIMPEWKDTFFKYVFTSAGEYKIDILDENNNFITSNVIIVTI